MFEIAYHMFNSIITTGCFETTFSHLPRCVLRNIFSIWYRLRMFDRRTARFTKCIGSRVTTSASASMQTSACTCYGASNLVVAHIARRRIQIIIIIIFIIIIDIFLTRTALSRAHTSAKAADVKLLQTPSDTHPHTRRILWVAVNPLLTLT